MVHRIFLSLLSIALVLMNTQPAYAQADSARQNANGRQDSRSRSRIAASVAFGVAGFDFSDFNARVGAAGLPSLRESPLPLGITTLQYHDPADRAFLDISFGVRAGEDDARGYRLRHEIGLFDVNLNVRAIRRDRHVLTPGLGFGFAGYEAHYARLSPVADFDAAAANIGSERTFRSEMNYYINLKAAYDFFFFPERDVAVGLRGGYRLGVGNERWNPLYNDAGNGPRSTASGYFVGAALSVIF